MTLTPTENRPVMAQAQSLVADLGIARLRSQLKDFPDLLERALATKREADDKVRRATEALAQARVEAEWELDAAFVKEGNTTYLLTTEEGQTEPTKRAMTADERRAWKDRAAEKNPAVAQAKRALLAAEAAQASARDAITVHQARGQALRHETDAAVAQLETLRTGLTPTAARLRIALDDNNGSEH